MRVIGTAGHVDHGKSSLVKALTGADPDRLKEEKQRQMTIDLGFAFFNMADGEKVGIVDVPGHRDFLENMLAGVGGIDAVLLVIAADEAVMPQTREHLAIIDLLRIRSGIIVLTKTDLVKDADWFSLVESDIRKLVKETVMENAQIVRVSSVTGEGIEQLKKEISSLLVTIPPPKDIGRPRLPIDRVFSIQGFGTVITGTLTGGSFRTGDTIQILVSKKLGRIRGLQFHNRQEDVAIPGSRTAINISGIDLEDVHRGDVIALPGMFQPTRRIDAWIEILADASTGLRHNNVVKFFQATTERIGRVRLLGKDVIEPGDHGWVQIEFEKDLVIDKGDHFILRRMSPAETLGGGLTVTSNAETRYKLNDQSVLARLEARLKPSSSEALFNLIEDSGFLSLTDIRHGSSEISSEPEADLRNLIEQGSVIFLPGKKDDFYTTKRNWDITSQKMVRFLTEYHAKYPLRPGMSMEGVKNRMNMREENLQSCIQLWIESGVVRSQGQFIALPEFQIKYSLQQRSKLDLLIRQIEQNPYNPPGIAEIKEMIGNEVFQSLLDQAIMIQTTPDIAFRNNEYQKMRDFAVETCREGTMLSVAQFRDHFSTSRKYALAFLEHLDQKGITERVGEGRRLKST
jgi:selenocysteine-specific elongation factor